MFPDTSCSGGERCRGKLWILTGADLIQYANQTSDLTVVLKQRFFVDF